VLGLGCRRRILLLLLLVDVLLLLLLFRLLLWLLLLRLLLLFLLRWGVRDCLVDEVQLLGHGAVDLLVVHCLIPPGEAGVLFPPLLVEEELETAADDAGDEDIGEGEALRDEVGVDEEMLFENFHVALGVLLAVVDVLLVVRVTANQGAKPGTESGQALGVGEGHPAEDGGVVLLGLAEQSGLFILRGDCAGILAATLIPVVLVMKRLAPGGCNQSVNTFSTIVFRQG